MKRQSNLFNKISEIDNLYLAFWKAKRGKALKEECVNYENNLEKNIFQLQKQLMSNNIDIGNYHYFTIHDPKKRTICAASFHERVLHHAIMNVCHNVFEEHLIYHTYATRPNKGTHKAINFAQKNIRKYKWFAKLDVRKYFDSINHEILKTALNKLFKEQKILLLFNKIINSYSCTEAFAHKRRLRLGMKGLPIGNLTSQYFANYYLSSADHFVLEKLHTPYLRYMDDMLLFADSKLRLTNNLSEFEEYITEKLNLELKPFSVSKTKNGVPFLGYRLFSNHILLNKASKKRFRRKLFAYNKKLNANIWYEQEYQEHILPLLDFVKYASTYGLRKNYIFVKKG